MIAVQLPTRSHFNSHHMGRVKFLWWIEQRNMQSTVPCQSAQV